jgi:hypothetical protein
MEVSELGPGEHRIRAQMGSVRVELARGIEVCIETHTNMGSVRNQYPSKRDAAAKLVVVTEMGSVRIDEGRWRSSNSWTGRPAAYPPAADRPQPPTDPARSEAPVATSSEPVPDQPKEKAADPELERILKMVESGELSAQEADELLQALGRA